MKIDIQSIKQIYAQVGIDDFPPSDIDNVVAKIGAQLGEVEEVIDLGKKYKDIMVAKVVSCEKHPDADKLKLCKIDDGGKDKKVKRDSEGLIQVVCGAPNVREGMLAAWLPPGSTVPATADKEPFVLESRELRGKVSNGMLASPNELGISDDHNGLLEVGKSAQPGDDFAELYKLDSYVIDIENKMFTHRPDCFGLLGVARELAGIYNKTFKSPDWFVDNPQFPEAEAELKLDVVNDIPELVSRFCAVAIADVKVAPSPLWLQVMLSKFGVKSVNNIVDLTNFYMLFTGQPLHAYDYDKVAALSSQGAVINIRDAKKGEKLKLLSGKEVSPEPGTIMIATDKRPIGIGGVIGGSETEVDDTTKNIILECANFNSYSIRRTSMAHGIFTDAVTRFTKNQSPYQTLAVISKSAKDIAGLSGGKVASELFDLKGKINPNKTIDIEPEFINGRLGLKLDANEISDLLSNVEFKIEKSEKGLKITAPFWRTDIEIPEDIVEEVGRLYGYDRLPLELPRKTMSAAQVSEELGLMQKLRERMSALGANEVLSYSFVKSYLLEAAGQDPAKSYKLKNALSPELEYYRQAITPSLLEKVHPNIKAGFDEFALFELGKVHIKGRETDGLPDESGRLALVVASKKNQGAPAFFTARKYLVDMLEALGIDENNISFETINPESYFQAGRTASVSIGGNRIGHIGEYGQKATNRLKLPEFCAGFELELEPLLRISRSSSYKPLSRYPSISQDLTVAVEDSITHARVLARANEEAQAHKPEDVEVAVSTIDIYREKSAAGLRQVTLRFTLVSRARTLNTEVANRLISAIENNFTAEN
ncbi:MAG TPA: phenylalanine--tRNA ligase subunit beta [Candidatus Saccharimonadales bacterium]|nr:phenylalanine--tRNA ligase subunit beta [Candidatus Saccharimonadales bacterium]